jgi:acyl-CoA dehydrogenase
MREFVRHEIWPIETVFDELGEDGFKRVIAPLQEEVKRRELWAAHLPPELGGQGFGQVKLGLMHEILGSSPFAPVVFGNQAPDSGNSEILALAGTPDQKEQWLYPLLAGDLRSAFSMTEPAHAGSDPVDMSTRAVLDGDEWVIDGHKWFSSGAEGATFGIVFAISDPDADTYKRGTMILVPADAPGITISPGTPVMGHGGRAWNTHCEVFYDSVRVPVANTLGERGEAFRLAQKRLGPGRIHHVMRWLGQMQRAFGLMCSHALEREAFGGPLADKQTVQNWIADSAAEIQACRLLTMDTARKIDEGSEARVEVSLLKFYAAGVLNEVIDRAIQVHGAKGLTDETPLARMAMHARAGRIYDGPDEVHRMVVARRILKSYAAGDPWQFS